MTKPQTVIEASWEVVNKVGGIYTVVRTKAELLVNTYKQYVLVGPLFPGRHNVEFTEQAPPERYVHVFEELRQEGIQCVYGVWNIPGNPQVVLLNAQHSHIDVNAVKGQLWEQFGVDSLRAAYEYDEPLRWAWAVGRFMELMQSSTDEPIVGHFHEWMAGLALLYLRMKKSRVRSVFTTHATMLGRTISGSTDINLYDSLPDLDFPRLAKELHVEDKYTTELACAKNAHVFTTVSEITGIEAEHVLLRKPDVLLFNGICRSQYPDVNDSSPMHIRARERMRDFLNYYFFSHYSFDLEHSVTFFASGRYEYRNKGLDVFTKALGKLNYELKKVPDSKTVIVFYFIPGDTQGIKTEVLEERQAFSAMQSYLDKNADDVVRRIMRQAQRIDSLSAKDILSEEAYQHVKQLAKALAHAGNPPLVTHNIPGEEHDPIVAGFRAHGLLNRAEDKVKVVRYPVYLTGKDGLLDLTYDEAVAGSHLGVFPSYYEPWGYTPMEAAAMGVPAITTDLAGFGRFVQTQQEKGVFVLKRYNRSEQDVVEDLFVMLKEFCQKNRSERRELKAAAQKLSEQTDWQVFIKHYYDAHQRAYESKD